MSARFTDPYRRLQAPGGGTGALLLSGRTRKSLTMGRLLG